MSSSYAEIFDEFTDRQLMSILQYQDYENVVILEPGIVKFTYNDRNYLIDNNYGGGSLSIIMIFDDADMSFEEMNNWNKDNRFVTVYETHGSVQLRMDLESGITEEYLLKAIDMFITTQRVFTISRLSNFLKKQKNLK
ncbi:hypothetical protein B0187_09890 [Haemophilus paracuniculus]|uniref:YbjN domain-containing protein n=1 Tax=Haemophilus paracuniculus TaxID=734 RepID=A0A1T0ANR3_9PAST|nr:hypothetical protein [Haemophilus paracuniculus]OOR97174.1 hypothetical protein B0187_09890 [Haemophilus paracuniculus]